MGFPYVSQFCFIIFKTALAILGPNISMWKSVEYLGNIVLSPQYKFFHLWTWYFYLFRSFLITFIDFFVVLYKSWIFLVKYIPKYVILPDAAVIRIF